MSPTAREDSAGATELDLEALVESWTGDRPSPAHWIETRGIARARSALQEALGTRAATILVTGPSGHGKTTLLRSFCHHPPSGFATVFVPSTPDVGPNQIAARILAATRSSAVHDAPGALSRLLRAQALRGARPVLLVDELEKMRPATLSKLLAIADASRAEVRMVVAGSPDALKARLRMLPQPVRKITVGDPWTRADAERLIACIGASLPIGAADSLAAIDLDELLRASRGNPRLVRAAIAAEWRQLNRTRSKIEPKIERIVAPPRAAASPDPASSEPAVSERANGESAPTRLFPGRPPPRSRSQSARAPARRRRRSPRAGLAISVGIAACIALALLVDRGDSPRGIAAKWPDVSVARIAETAAVFVAHHGRWITEQVPERLTAAALAWLGPRRAPVAEAPIAVAQPTTDVAEAPSAAAVAPIRVAEAPTAVAEPPIRVAVNSDPWANVEVDGEEAGSTPLTVELAPGPHRLRAAMADGRVIEREFEVTAGRNRIALP